jgi:hypothetical protein
MNSCAIKQVQGTHGKINGQQDRRDETMEKVKQ